MSSVDSEELHRPSLTALLRRQPAIASRFCMPGEFERQQAILVAPGRLADISADVLADVATAVRGHVQLLALVESQDDEDRVYDILKNLNLSDDELRTVPLAIDSQWVRDYGPLFVRDGKGRIWIVDAAYHSFERPNDDGVPAALGKAMGLRVLRLPIVLDGGNLLSNGAGLFLATANLLTGNQPDGVDEVLLRSTLEMYLGTEYLVLLEPLVGEPTGHVDMFATFTDAKTVVVASCDANEDPENARILDENAARLAAVPAPYGPLRVVRISMPSHADGIWRTYNNVLFANGALLVPVYPTADPNGREAALAVYREALPNWRLVPIDATSIIQFDGALHCISMNVPASLR